MKKNLIILLIGIISFSFQGQVIAQETYKEITLEKIFKQRTFSPSMVYGIKSMNDGEHYCTIKKGNIEEFSYKTGDKVGTIVTSSKIVYNEDTLRISSYNFSQDEKKIIFPTETEYIYRHSSKSNYFIWDIEKETLSALSKGGKQRLATFSPDGTMVAFVRENNIFIKDLESGSETQVTEDGLFNNIIYGTADWVYEEEFAFTKAFAWSPDGSKISFYRFDESNVKEYFLTYYGELYPEEYKYKYPKAGEDNSIVEIFVYNLNSNKTTKMDIGAETDQYIPRIKWTKEDNTLGIFRLNRLQNKLELLLNNAETGDSKVVYTDENKYYITESIYSNMIFTDGKFVITSEKDGYMHIYLYSTEGELIKQLTKGEWDVTDLIGFDSKKKLVYYISAEVSPLDRDLYSVNEKGKINKISQKTGSNSARFSKTYKYFINTYTNANTPPYITVNKSNGKEIRVLKDNAKLLETMKEYEYSKKGFFSFKTSESVELNGWKILPPDFDPSKKYPVLMYVYGGPGSQTVRNSWGRSTLFWFEMLAQKGIIVISVDNRGTGARGEEFKKMTYKELGKYETIDQIEAAKYLASLDYIDADHIGIFGWSYGGFMSTLCLTKGADVFSTAIAVAPVTNWRYYDNIYTERFMRTPQENPNGYDDNSPINHVDKMKGNYLLVHGGADDNVHPQNTWDLISALVAADKQFEMKVYPNKNHGIYGGNTTMHLYRRMTDFLLENLSSN